DIKDSSVGNFPITRRNYSPHKDCDPVDEREEPFELQWRRHLGRKYVDCKGLARYEDIQREGCKK
ncbi:MAG: hypothetical protein KKF39_06715, partial [Nanoarchaeota archaeon]|nr:hypothetical protein [Nanoarchaeota archaeon]